MTDESPHRWSWTAGNLTAIALLTALGIGLVGWRVWVFRGRLGDDLVVRPTQLQPAGEKINPNTASWASLARLPGIGPGRAKAICRYREQFKTAHPDRQAFQVPADLKKVSGLGPILVEGITPYLAFPPPSSQPALGPATPDAESTRS